MSNLFQFNKSYKLADGLWIESPIPDNMIKYSLASSATLVEQVPMIAALLNELSQVFVTVSQGHCGEFWEVFVGENDHFALKKRLTESEFDFLKCFILFN